MNRPLCPPDLVSDPRVRIGRPFAQGRVGMRAAGLSDRQQAPGNRQLVVDIALLQLLRAGHGRDVGPWNPREGG